MYSKSTKNFFRVNDSVIDELTLKLRQTPDRAEQRVITKKIVDRELDQVLRMWMPYDAGFLVFQPHVRNASALSLRRTDGYGSAAIARLWRDKKPDGLRRRLAKLGSLFDQGLEKPAGGGSAPVARALDAADQPALAIDQVRGGRTPDSVDPARHVTGGVEEDGGHVPLLLRRLLHEVRTLAEVHEQDLEPLGLELPV